MDIKNHIIFADNELVILTKVFYLSILESNDL